MCLIGAKTFYLPILHIFNSVNTFTDKTKYIETL